MCVIESEGTRVSGEDCRIVGKRMVDGGIKLSFEDGM